MQRKFTQAFHIPGTLGADIAIVFTAPSDCQLVHCSAVASNNSDATLKLGTTSDDDAYLAAGVIGDSNAPVEKERADFIGAQFPRISDGDIVKVSLDHDGGSGTAAADATIVLTFVEG
jgi:anti-sigma-K factor RskA